MKNFFIALLFNFSFLATALGYPLIVSERIPGFEPARQHKLFVIDSSGVMTMKIKDFIKNKTWIERVGTLSTFTMNRLRTEIRQIQSATKLIDQSEGGLECMDPPEYNVHVRVAGKLKPIYRSANCHEWRLENYQGWKSIELSLGFLEL